MGHDFYHMSGGGQKTLDVKNKSMVRFEDYDRIREEII